MTKEELKEIAEKITANSASQEELLAFVRELDLNVSSLSEELGAIKN